MSNESEKLKQGVVSGVRWSAVAAWGQQSIQLVVTLVMARLLVPDDYGLLALAVVFVGFLDVFSSMGFGVAVIQRREVSDSLSSSLFYLNLGVGALLSIATLCSVPLCGWIYQEPRVMPVMALLSLNFLMAAPAIIPTSLLTRNLRFGRIAFAQITSKIVGGTVGIVMAATGWGVWSLVLPTVFLGTPLKTGILLGLSGWRPRLVFRWHEVHDVLGFGANVTGFAVVNYFSRNADNFIIGTFLGVAPLAYYSLAYSILLKPRDAITSVFTRVLLPTFSRLQDDDQRLKRAYLRACGAIAFVTFPMMFGLAAVAPLFVDVVLGAKWQPAVPVICILAPLGALQSVAIPIGEIYLTKNRSDWYFRMGCVQGVLTVGVFLAGVPWGIIGVAVSYAVFNVIWVPAWIWLGSRLVVGLRVRDVIGELLPYGFLSLAMVVIVLLCQTVSMQMQVARIITLTLSVAAGVVAYTGLTVVMQPSALRDLVHVFPKRWTGALLRVEATVLRET